MTPNNAAAAFLRKYGHTSLVNLGCGSMLNRIDNHIRLIKELGLTYYVGIDIAPQIEMSSRNIFTAPDGMAGLLAVVCQRVYPDCRWEEVILSMTPKLVLQEDLHGCERQQLRGRGYVRTWSKIRRYGLQPFRPWPILPRELNLILWRRRNFDDEEVETSRWRVLLRLRERFIG